MEFLCTYRDVLALVPQLFNEDKGRLSPLNEQEIYNFILQAGSELISQLSPWYGRDLKLSTRRTTLPTRGYNNSTTGYLALSDGTNTITVNAAAKTQCFKVEFTAATEFKITSDLYGGNVTGNTSQSVTVPSGITIPHQLWSGTFVTGDIFYIPVYEYESMLSKLTALSASVSILDSIYTEQMPNASENASRYLTTYNSLLKGLKDQTAFLEIGVAVQNLDPIEIPYDIDQNGFDVTEYP